MGRATTSRTQDGSPWGECQSAPPSQRRPTTTCEKKQQTFHLSSHTRADCQIWTMPRMRQGAPCTRCTASRSDADLDIFFRTPPNAGVGSGKSRLCSSLSRTRFASQQAPPSTLSGRSTNASDAQPSDAVLSNRPPPRRCASCCRMVADPRPDVLSVRPWHVRIVLASLDGVVRCPKTLIQGDQHRNVHEVPSAPNRWNVDKTNRGAGHCCPVVRNNPRSRLTLTCGLPSPDEIMEPTSLETEQASTHASKHTNKHRNTQTNTHFCRMLSVAKE